MSGTALLAAIFLYTGAHALYYDSWHYDSWPSALAPLASGVALLAVIFLYLHGFAHALLRIPARPARPGQIDPRHDPHRAIGLVVTVGPHRGLRHA